MSALSRWDRQLLQTEMNIVELLKEVSRNPDPITSNATVHERDQIDHALAQISVDVEKVILASRKAQKGGRSNAAVGWWTKQLVLKIKSLAQDFVALQNRKMWLRLLQARFASSKANETVDLQAKHLVDLAIRKRQLEELENALKNDLNLIVREREYLKSEYESLGTADENWSASGSFQSRLGVNFQHAKENPSTRAFSDCLNVLSVPMVHPEENKWLRKVNADLMKKSGTLAEQCKELASAVAKGSSSVDKISTTQFRTTMEQVMSLNEQVSRKIAAIRRRPLKQSRPKLVQNNKKDDKTMARP